MFTAFPTLAYMSFKASVYLTYTEGYSSQGPLQQLQYLVTKLLASPLYSVTSLKVLKDTFQQMVFLR